MVKELVTIVLPIYNVENYLDRCIVSVVNQTYKKLEIILIDDGSTDRSPQICEEWVNKDNRIKVIHKMNEGLGQARNTGIYYASGEYICFFDSDDYIALNAVEKAYNQIKKYDSELVLFGHYDVDKDGRIKRCIIPHTDNEFYEGNDVQNYVLANLISPDLETGKNTNLWMSAWACMYSLNAINRANWKFVSERQYISEDLYSLLYLYKNIRSVAILSDSLYFYCFNGDSLSRRYRSDRYKKNVYCYDACQELCNQLGYNKDVKNRLKFYHIGHVIGVLESIVKLSISYKERIEKISEIITSNHTQALISQIYISKKFFKKRLLLKAFRKKQVRIVYILLWLQNIIGGK